MKVRFGLNPFEHKAQGPNFGYLVHSRHVYSGLEKRGYLTTDVEAADWVMTILNTGGSEPLYGPRNVLFTMVETDPPNVWGEGMYCNDLLITPCKFSKEAMGKFYRGPIEVVPEGVDPAMFPFYKHQHPGQGKPFRFLWVGSDKDTRKGGQLLRRAFQTWVASGKAPKNVELYYKTSHYEGHPAGVSYAGQITTDARKLSAAELLELYNSAACFVFPSLGEGWGLTLTEAMSAGVPCISSMNTSMLDYFDESVGYTLTDFARVKWMTTNPAAGHGWAPKHESVIAAMERVYHNYEAALFKAEAASERMRTSYTWDHANEKLIDVLERHMHDPKMTPRERCPDFLYNMYVRARRTWIFEQRQHLPPNTSSRQLKKMIARSKRRG